MPIVMISESLLNKATAKDGRILRDRVLSGFCVRMNARTRTFRVATSVAGKQFRLTLGHWPLMSVEEARGMAMEVLRECRAGRMPAREVKVALPVGSDKTVIEEFLEVETGKGSNALKKTSTAASGARTLPQDGCHPADRQAGPTGPKRSFRQRLDGEQGQVRGVRPARSEPVDHPHHGRFCRA